MSIREWTNNNSIAVTVVAILLLVLASGALVLQLRGSSSAGPDSVYFVELETGHIFSMPGSTTPPTTGPSGGEAWFAHVFSCGACAPDEWFGYVDRYSDEAQALREDPDIDLEHPDTNAFMRQNRFIRPLDPNAKWVPYESREAENIRRAISTRCNSRGHLIHCIP